MAESPHADLVTAARQFQTGDAATIQLLGALADEIERLQLQVASYYGQLAVANMRTVDAELNARYDPMNRDELIAYCERLRSLLHQCEPYLCDIHGNDIALLGEVRSALTRGNEP